MCGFGGGNDDAQEEAERSREDMERRERERQRQISQGKTAIDGAFSQFDDNYYSGYKGKVLDYYNPQIEDQYGDAQAKLVAALAGRGQLESTAGAGAFADVSKEYNTQRTGVANQAVDAAQKLQGNVENQKTDLYALNAAAADAKGMGARAVGSATALTAPPTLSPIGRLFDAVLQPWLNYRNAAGNAPGAAYQSPVRSGSPAGSGRVIT
jgi:hypothetical protein